MKLLQISRHTKYLSKALLAVCIASTASAGTLIQTFEDGEDTSNWGSVEHPSAWTNGAVDATFLDEALGGENAGTGASDI